MCSQRPCDLDFTRGERIAIAGIVDAQAHGAREGGAPLVVLALVLAAWSP